MTQVKEAKANLQQIKNLLKQAEESLAKKDSSPTSLTNYIEQDLFELMHLGVAVCCLCLVSIF